MLYNMYSTFSNGSSEVLPLTSLSGHRDKSKHEGPPPCLRLLVTMTTTWVGCCPMGCQSQHTCRPLSQPILHSLLHWCLMSLLLHLEIGSPRLTEKERLHIAEEKKHLVAPKYIHCLSI